MFDIQEGLANALVLSSVNINKIEPNIYLRHNVSSSHSLFILDVVSINQVFNKKIFFNVTKQIICIHIVHTVRPVSIHDVLEEGVGELPGDLAQAAPQLLAVQPQISLFH